MMRCRSGHSMIRRAALLCACGAAVMTSGCAMMGHMRPAADSYTYDMGVASAADIRVKSADLFKGLGYKLARDDQSEPLYLETQWLYREPTDSEERMRGSEIVSRIKVRGAPQDARNPATMYHVLLTVENRFVPTRGTRRDARDASSSATYAEAIVKGMSVAFGGSARPVANEPRPF